jgi:hypothetical protein
MNASTIPSLFVSALPRFIVNEKFIPKEFELETTVFCNRDDAVQVIVVFPTISFGIVGTDSPPTADVFTKLFTPFIILQTLGCEAKESDVPTSMFLVPEIL